MTKTIILQGRMGELFGETHKLNVNSIQEAMHALDCLKGGVKRYLMECQDLGIPFTVQRGSEVKEYAENEELFLDNQDMLNFEFEDDAYIITPLPAGSGKASDFFKKIVVAIFLIWVGITFGPGGASELGKWGARIAQGLGYIGASLAVDAITDLMIPDPDRNSEGAKASLFNGPVNTTKPGIPIPLAYGEVEAGGAVINFGFTNRLISSSGGYQFSSPNIDTGGSNPSDGGGNYSGTGGGGNSSSKTSDHTTSETYQK